MKHSSSFICFTTSKCHVLVFMQLEPNSIRFNEHFKLRSYERNDAVNKQL